VNTLARLTRLNLAQNQLPTIDFVCPAVTELCIQMNCFDKLGAEFASMLGHLRALELDWFKYCKPSIAMKQNFERDHSTKVKLQILFSMHVSKQVAFHQVVEHMSIHKPNY
jgi:hypothetical protein